jgi:glycosyltransferase involved in cell wall biosynthesis
MFISVKQQTKKHVLIDSTIAIGCFIALSPWLLPHGTTLAALAALGLIILIAALHPQWTLFIFAIGLPLHNLLMAWLYHATGSATLVHIIQPWKETALAVALLRIALPAIIQRRQLPRLRITALDVTAALFIALCAVSVARPNTLISFIGRLYGFRDLVVPLGAYLLGRLAPLSRREWKVLIGILAGDIIAFALTAIGERVLWGNALLLALGYGSYIHDFLDQSFPLPHNIPFTFYTDGWFPRAGSLALNPLDLAVLLMIASPIVLAVMEPARQDLPCWASGILSAAALLGGVALVLAVSRASLVLLPLALVLLALNGLRKYGRGIALTVIGGSLGAIIVLMTVSLVSHGATPAARVALANQGLVRLLEMPPQNLPAAVGLPDAPPSPSGSSAAPAASGIGSSAQQLFQVSTSSANTSTQGHLASLHKLWGLIVHHPTGYGIGIAGAVGNRFHTSIGGETSYLTVGVELGILGLLLYLALFGEAIFACWQVVRSRSTPLIRAIFLGAGLAWLIIALDGIMSEVTLNLFAMYLLWWMAGAARTQHQRSHVIAVPATNDQPARWSAPPSLRVAIDAQCLQTARTGVRTYLDELLKQWRRPGLPHTILPLYGPRRLPSHRRIFRIINQAIYFLWLHGWLPLRLALSNVDVLFCPEYLTPIWVPVARVVTCHDAAFLRRPQDYNRIWLWLFHKVTLPAIRRADAVIAPSQYTAQEIVEYAHVPADRLHIVPLGVNADEIRSTDEHTSRQILTHYGVQPCGYLLHVGVLERRKNLVTLIKAFAIWRERGAPPDCKLLLVGQPGPRPDLDDSANIRQAIADYGLQDHVILTGHLPAEARNALYTHAAAVVIPSLLEGFGIPVLEAFAAQVPAIVARSAALPEVAGNAALFFDPLNPDDLANALLRLQTDPALRAALVQAGNERLHTFTWEQTAAATLTVCAAAMVHAFAPPCPPEPETRTDRPAQSPPLPVRY